MPTLHASKTFKTVRGYILIAATIAGCGGGGGGDGEQSVPDVCRSYCSFICTRASNCGYFPASQITTCDNSCVSTIASNGGTAAACNQRGEQVAAASCAQLGSMLGLRSLNKNTDFSSKQQEDSEAIAEHSGAELASSVIQ